MYRLIEEDSNENEDKTKHMIINKVSDIIRKRIHNLKNIVKEQILKFYKK